MPKSVAEIGTHLRKFTQDKQSIASTFTRQSTLIKEWQDMFAIDSRSIMTEANEIDAKTAKAKAELKRKYEESLQNLEDNAKIQKDQARDKFMAAAKKILVNSKIAETMTEMRNVANGCKQVADACDQFIKELPKASGDGKQRKEADAAAKQTSKDFRALQKQFSTVADSAKNTLAAFA